MLDGPTEIDWLVTNIIPPGTTGLLAGDSGIGKSWLVGDLALAIATGAPWLGVFPVRQGSVLVVDAENAELLLRVRMNMLLSGRRVSAESIPLHFIIDERVDFSPTFGREGVAHATPSVQRLRETISELSPALVICDSLTRFHSAKEIDANEMAAVFANVGALVRETGTCILFTHHIRKAGGDYSQRIRGSTDIRAFMDYVLFADKSPDGILIAHEKSRWSEPVTPFGVRMASTGDSMTLTHTGERPVAVTQDPWAWLRQTLWEEGQNTTECTLSRQELIERASGAGICKGRKLDDVIAAKSKSALLVKSKHGKDTMITLGDRVIDELDGQTTALYFSATREQGAAIPVAWAPTNGRLRP